MKNVGYIFKLTAILLVITVVVAGLLGFVNDLTADKIAENTEKTAREAMKSVLTADKYEKVTDLDETYKDNGITEVYTCEAGYVVRVSVSGFGGDIDMMVGIDNNAVVQGISIISHSETASLGSKCKDDKQWQKNFIEAAQNTTGELAVTKDGGTIEAVTGATVSSRAVTGGVNVALDYVKEVQG